MTQAVLHYAPHQPQPTAVAITVVPDGGGAVGNGGGLAAALHHGANRGAQVGTTFQFVCNSV